jgi:hypothetical protein
MFEVFIYSCTGSIESSVLHPPRTGVRTRECAYGVPVWVLHPSRFLRRVGAGRHKAALGRHKWPFGRHK